jgi:hypothetical protein
MLYNFKYTELKKDNKNNNPLIIRENFFQNLVDFNELLQVFTEYAPKKQAEEALYAFINASFESRLILGYANTELS